MDSIAQQVPIRRVAVGIDTHKHSHVAVVLDELGGRLGELTVPADSGGHEQVERWAKGYGRSWPSASRARAPTEPVSRATSGGRATGHRGQPTRPARSPAERQERCP
jgi:hypothetical protein